MKAGNPVTQSVYRVLRAESISWPGAVTFWSSHCHEEVVKQPEETCVLFNIGQSQAAVISCFYILHEP